MSALQTDSNIENILFKKYSGVVQTNVQNTVNQEPPILAYPKIFPDTQVYNQPIPPTVPLLSDNTGLLTDFTPPVSDILFLSTSNDLSTLCENRQVLASHPYIVRYVKMKLTDFTLNTGFSYRFAGINPGGPSSGLPTSVLATTNLLSQTIPFNYEPGLSYQYYVYLWNPAAFPPRYESVASDDSTYPWIFDTDAGYITIFGPAPQDPTKPPLVTFWRYEGIMGLGSGGGGTPVTEKKTLSYYLSFEPSATLPAQPSYVNINNIHLSIATRININIIDRTQFSKNNILSLLAPDDLIYITTAISEFIHIYKIQFIKNNQPARQDWTFIVLPLNTSDGSTETVTSGQIYSVSFDVNSNRIPIYKIKF
jgi:hypothetical protein